MRTARNSLFLLLLLLARTFGAAQAEIDPSHSTGPSVSWGAGNYAVTDKLISSQRYDGTIYFAECRWSDVVGTRIYDVGLAYYHSRAIRNYTVPASVEEPRLTVGIRYVVAQFALAGMPSAFSLGPAFEILMYYRKDDIAAYGNSGYSVTATGFMGSARVNTVLTMSPLRDVLAGVGLQANVFTLAGRNTSSSSLGTNGITLMTVPDALRLDLEAMVSCRLIGGLNVGVEYRFDAARIADTYEFVEVSSIGILTLSYTF